MKEFYRGALESMSEGVLILDPHGRVQYVNIAGENILGIKRCKITGSFFEEVLKLRKENNEFTQAILDGVFRFSVNQTSRIVDFVTKNARKTLSLTTSVWLIAD